MFIRPKAEVYELLLRNNSLTIDLVVIDTCSCRHFDPE